MPQKKLWLGGGAQCSVLLKYLRPKPAVNAYFVNYVARDCVTDLTAVRLDEVTRKSKTYMAVFFTAPWTTKAIYCTKHYVTVVKEGPANLIFELTRSNASSPDGSQGSTSQLSYADGEESIYKSVFHPTGNRAEDIALVCNLGLEVDDDIQPAPKNVPEGNQPPMTTNLYAGQTWDWDGINQWEVVINTKNDASFENGWTPVGKSWMDIF